MKTSDKRIPARDRSAVPGLLVVMLVLSLLWAFWLAQRSHNRQQACRVVCEARGEVFGVTGPNGTCLCGHWVKPEVTK